MDARPRRALGGVGLRFAWLAAALAGCGAPGLVEIDGRAFGSTWRVTWSGRADAAAVRAAAEAELAVVDRIANSWDPDAEIRRLRGSEGATPVSAELAALTRVALDVAAASEGAFDPTVQPLVALWSVHDGPRASWPTEAEIAAARAQVGWQAVQLRVDGPAPTLDLGGRALDLAGIAPGYAADRISAALSALGAPNHLVDVGGELRVAGAPPGGGAWQVAVDRPEAGLPPGAAPRFVYALAEGALATSGDYRAAHEVGGVRVGQTIDPRVGGPSTAGVASATVIAPDAARADAWATALMVLGEAGLPLLRATPGLDAVLLLPDPRGGLRAVGTSGTAGRWTPGPQDRILAAD